MAREVYKLAWRASTYARCETLSAMYGWRARVGLVVPGVNTVMEAEFNYYLPEGVSVHAARLESVPELTIEHLSTVYPDLEDAAVRLTEADVACCVYGLGVTPGSIARGAAYDDEVESRLRDATGMESVAGSRSLRRALDALGASSVAMLTPYTDDINAYLVEHAGDWGYDIVAADGFRVSTGREIKERSTEAVYQQATALDHEAADAIIIGGTNQRSGPVVSTLEADLGKPVVSANQAILWDILDRIDIGAAVDWGSLFER